jgi:hypothetical protein
VNAPPPEASTEYSRGLAPPRGAAPDLSGAVGVAVMGATLLGALLLIVAEFTTLFTVHAVGVSAPVKSVGTGSHDSYALILIAVLAVALAWGAAKTGNRWALVALLALGVAALLIALIGDLPDAQASGTIGSMQAGFRSATDKPSAGMYLETLGAIVLMIAGGCGLLLGAPGSPRAPDRRRKSAP